MDTRAGSQRVYRELADWYEHHGEPPMRDRFLVLAADAALAEGQTGEAERLRQRLLQGNPHHLLKPYASFSQAILAPDVQTYIHDLRLNYPAAEAEELLRTLRQREEQPPDPDGPTMGPPRTLTDDATLPLGATVEPPLKVYQVREEPDATVRSIPPTTTAAPRRPPTRTEPPPPKANIPVTRSIPPTKLVSRGTAPLPRKAPAPRPAEVPRDPLFEPPPPPPANEPDPAGGAWLTFLLFGVVFTAGAVLAVYTLARPFLPAHLLP